MKKLFTLLFTLGLLQISIAQEIMQELNGGVPLTQEQIDESAVINQNGTMYFIYTSGGALKAFSSNDNGTSFFEETINFLGNSLSNTQNFSLYQRGYEDWLVFFEAELGTGDEGLFALEVSDAGELILSNSGRLDQDFEVGSIEGYDVVSGHGTEFTLAYVKSGMLNYVWSNQEKQMQSPIALSDVGNQVNNSELHTSLDGEETVQWGYYFLNDGSTTSIHSFQLSNGTIIENAQLDTGLDALAFADSAKNRSGSLLVGYSTANQVIFKKKNDSGWDAINFDSLPLFDKIIKTQIIPVKDGFAGYVLATLDGENQLYTWTLSENSSTISSQGPVNRTSVLEVSFNDNGLLAVLAWQESGSSIPGVYSLEKSIGVWLQEGYIPQSSGDLVSTSLLETGNFETVLVSVFNQNGIKSAEIFIPSGNGGNRYTDLTTVSDIPTSSVISLLNRTVLFSNSSQTLAYNLDTNESETFNWGSSFPQQGVNGTALAFLDGMAYEVPSLPEAPAGAFSTFGNPLSMNSPYVRLYGWNQAIAGALSFQIQYQGFMPYVLSKNEIHSASSYIDSLFLNRTSGDTYSLEIWGDNSRVFSNQGLVNENSVRESLSNETVNSLDYSSTRVVSSSLSRFSSFGISASITNTSDWSDGLINLTNNNVNDETPQIDGSKVVWRGYDGSDYEIYLWEDGTTTQITNNSLPDYDPQISNSRIVWRGYDGSDYEIYLWENGSTTQLSNNAFQDYEPYIDGSRIVWRGYDGNDYEIFLWEDGVATQITNNDTTDSGPIIDGASIVWRGSDSNDGEIFLWMDSIITQLTDNSLQEYGPQISNSRIVWRGFDGNDYEIYLWENGSITQITNNESPDSSPQIDNLGIVWVGNDGTDGEIYYWKDDVVTQLTNNGIQDTSPTISSSRVVWTSYDGVDYEIYLWEDGNVTQLTENNVNDYTPNINGTRVVWSHNFGNDREIYLLKLDWTGPIVDTTIYSQGFPVADGAWLNGSAYVRLDELRDPDVGIPSGLDESTLEYRINSGTWTSIAATDALNTGVLIDTEGTYLVEYRAADLDGNLTTSQVTVNLDLTEPVIADLGTFADWQSEITITASASDTGGSGLDSTTWEYKRYPADQWHDGNPHTFEYSGQNEISFRVADNAGNYSQASTVLRIDRGPPIISGVSVLDSQNSPVEAGVWSRFTPLTITANANDSGIGLDETTWFFRTNEGNQSSAPSGSWQSGNTSAISTNGITTIEFKVSDLLGNESEVFSYDVYIDTIAPVISVKAAPGENSPIDVTIDGETYTAADGKVIISAFNSIYITNTIIEDGADVSFVTPGTVTFGPNVDIQLGAAVEVIRTFPDEGWVRDAGAEVQFTGTDSLSGIDQWYYAIQRDSDIGQEPIETEYLPISTDYLSGLDGESEVWLKAVDQAGNNTVISLVLRVDGISPSINFPVSDLSAFFNGDYTIPETSAVDTGSGINQASWQYSLNGTDFYAGRTVPSSELGTSGPKSISYRVLDNVGNETITTATIKFDFDPPQITFNVVHNSGVATVTASAQDGYSGPDYNTWQYAVDGAAWQAISGSSPSIEITEAGDHDVQFRISDLAGNQETYSETVTNDGTGPVITTTGTTWEDVTSANAFAFAEDAESGVDPSSWQYQIGSTDGLWLDILGITDPSATVDVNITQEGRTSVYFRVADNLGNLSDPTAAIIEIDRSAPTYSAPQILDFDSGTINITAGVTDWTNSSTVYFTASPSDGTVDFGSGIETIQWTLEDPLTTSNWNNGSMAVITAEGVRTITFRAVDYLAHSTEISYTLRVDRTAPIITSGSLSETYINSEIQFTTGPSGSDTDSGFDDGSFQYSLDSSSGPWTDYSSNINLLSLNNGIHNIYVSGLDIAGNRGISTPIAITIDRIEPVISAIGILDGDEIIEETDFSGSTSVTVDVSFIETIDGTLEGQLARYEYLVSTEPLVDPALTEIEEGPEQWILGGLSNGLNYLYLRAVDQAGNQSAIFERIIRVDDSSPARPTLISLSHPEAESDEDAIAENNAIFRIVPNNSGNSGIDHYEWELKQGIFENTASVIQSGTTVGLQIEFTSLSDNQPGEFYFLSLVAVSGSGRTSLPSKFTFRIDSTPPNQLVINSNSHALSDVWYNSGIAQFTWNEPQDFTGIKTYQYQYSETQVYDENQDPSTINTDSWTSTQNQSLLLDLEAITGVKTGQLYLAVSAEDFAGNKQFDQFMVQFDTEKPSIDSNINISVDGPGRTASAVWNTPSDNRLDGYSHTEIRLGQRNDDGSISYLTNWLYLDGATTNYDFEGLNNDESLIYTVFIKAIDTAGNSSVAAKGFSFSGEPVVIDISYPFSSIIQGYLVEGMYSTNPDNQEAYLILPEQLLAKEGEAELERVTLENISFDNGEFLSGDNASISFQATIQGFDLEILGLQFSSTNGLVLSSASYDNDLDGDDFDTLSGDLRFQANYSNLGITAAPEYAFRTNQASNSENLVFESSIIDSEASTESHGWTIIDSAIHGFDSNAWILNGPNLDVSLISDLVNAYVFEDPNKRYVLSLDQARTDYQREIIEAGITENFILEATKNIFEVSEARLLRDRIYISESILQLPVEVTTDTVTAQNFSIGRDGMLREEPGFSVSNFTIIHNGQSFPVNDIYIQDGILLIDTTISTNSGNLEVTGLELTNAGFNFDNPPQLENISHNYFGFGFVSDSLVMLDDSLLVESGRLSMPAQFGGNEVVIEDLEIAISDFSILSTGTSSTDFLVDNAYGEGIAVRTSSLRPEGYFADIFAVTLPTVLGSEELVFSNVPLLSDGSIGESANLNAGSLELAGFTLNILDAQFLADSIVFNEVSTTLPVGYTPSEIGFKNLTVNSNGIIEVGTNQTDIYTHQYGWNLNFDNSSIDETSIVGQTEILLPAAFGSRLVKFPQARIYADGTLETGDSGDDVFFRIHGWKVWGKNISLEEGIIRVGEGHVRLYNIMGGETLVVPDLLLTPEGQLAGSGTGSDVKSFLSTNGFRVDATGYTFTDEQLMLSGTVAFPSALGDVTPFFNQSITLHSSGIIETTVNTNQINYSVAGFTLSAQDYMFNEEGLYIGTTGVPIPNTSLVIPIGDIWFYADGNFKVAGKSFEGISFKPDGAGIELGVTSISLSSEGVKLEAFVTLPESIADETIFFESLTLHPDGSITSDIAIRQFDFDLFNFHFDLRTIRYDQEGFSIGEAFITMPEDFGGKTLRITDFKILNNGDFSIGGLGLDPFELWGYQFQLKSLGISSDEISFTGSIRLPNDFVIEQLQGLEIDINSFRIALTGELRDFSVSINREFSFPLFDSWTLRVDTITIDKEFLRIEKGSLDLPPDLGLDTVEVKGIVINVLTGDITTEGIALQGVDPIEFAGLTINVDSLTIHETRGLEFTGSVVLPDYFPSGFNGRFLEVTMFQIKPDFTIGDVTAELNGINTPILDDLLFLENGSIGIDKSGSGLILSGSGDVTFSGRFPIGIAGKTLSLNDFAVNTETGEILIFDASSENLSINLFGSLLVEVDNLSITYNSVLDTFITSVNGDIVLGSDFPESIRGERIAIEAFTINGDGEITEFAANFDLPGTRPLFDSIYLKDALISSKLNSTGNSVLFDLEGSILFGDSFPEGIAGTEVAIKQLQFDSTGEINELDVDISFSNFDLFGTLPVENLYLRFVKADDGIESHISGDIVMPDFFPEGLAGRRIVFNEFIIGADGTILSLEAGLEDLDLDIFSVLSLRDGEITVKNEGNDEFIFTVNGFIKLPDGLVNELSNMELAIRDFRISSTRGVLSFNIGNASPIAFELFGGIQTVFTTLEVTDSHARIAGNLQFPSSYPEGLANLSIGLNDLVIGWDGEIQNIEAGLEHLTIRPGGFILEIDDLYVLKDRVSLGSAILNLPANMNDLRLGVRNAGITYSGQFYGDIVTPTIDLDLAGFGLVLHDPSFNFAEREITISKAEIKTPELVGSIEFALNGVKISPSGLSFTGGAFRLPDFSIAGGIGFKDLLVDFQIDGDQYFIRGSGSAILPGAGTLHADISFINQSSEYPIGIKRAFFSYTLSGVGLPLGTTGLYLSQIRGGIAFGPPDEIPAKVRSMFDSGMRLQLGLTLQDQTQGNVVKGDIDVWIDITDFDWAFKGEVTVLKGMAHGEVVAALTKQGFYGSISVRLVFVRGTVEVYVFKHQGSTQVNGRGTVQFGLRKGTILHIKFKIWTPWKTYRIEIAIPPVDIWLPEIGAEFGLFKNGQRGFKGYVKLPIWGNVGVFVPQSGGIQFGNVSQYELIMPSASYSMQSVSRQLSTSSTGTESNSSLRGNVMMADRSFFNSTVGPDVYQFSVPAPSSGGSSEPELPVTPRFSIQRATSSAPSLAVNSVDPEDVQDRVERIVFALGYVDGEPEMTAISPSGARFGVGHPNVLIEYTEYGALLAVLNPEPGRWTVEVDNMLNNEMYRVAVFGKTAVPEIEVDTPAYSGQLSSGVISIEGTAVSTDDGPAAIRIYLSEEMGNYLGREIAEVITDDEGRFVAEFSTEGLNDGEYYIFAGVDAREDMAEAQDYAPGSFIVNNGNTPLAAVENLIVSDNGTGEIGITFTDINGDRSDGFTLYIDNETQETSEEINIGYVTHLTLPGYQEGDTLAVRVAAYDNAGREGNYSDITRVEIAGQKYQYNTPEMADSTTIGIEIGGTTELNLPFTTSNTIENSDAYDFVDIAVTEIPEDLNIGFDQEGWNVHEISELPLTFSASDEIAPGEYEIIFELRNKGNRDLKDQIIVMVQVEWPTPQIFDVNPTEWHTDDEISIGVYGSNFIPGTRLFLGEAELVFDTNNPSYIESTVPAGQFGGVETLRVVGPGGNEATAEVTVLEPSYVIIGYKTLDYVAPGQTARFNLSLEGENGFSSGINLSLDNLPINWTSNAQEFFLGLDQNIEIEITVPNDAAVGVYELLVTSEENDALPLTVEVSDETPVPYISSMTGLSALPGDSMSLFGYGFGDETVGELYIGNLKVEPIFYSDKKIDFIVPDSAATGDIYLIVNGQNSNSYTLYIETRGFSIHPQQNEVEMVPGETLTQQIFINGFSKTVDLEVSTDFTLLNAELDSYMVTPNGSRSLTIIADPSIPNGNYTITILGREADLVKSETISVVIGEAFTIENEELPEGMEGSTYSAQIRTLHGEDPVRFELKSGTLPAGILFSGDGRLTGKPRETGTFAVVIEARDSENDIAEKNFTIIIRENAWAWDEKDAGNTSYNPVLVPADDRILWTTDEALDASNLITGRNHVYLNTQEGIKAYQKKSGEMAFGIEGQVDQVFYSNDKLYILSNGLLQVRDSQSGNLYWEREGIQDLQSNGMLLFLLTEFQIEVLDSTDGALIEVINAQWEETDLFLWKEGILYRAQGMVLERLEGESWVEVITLSNEIIDIAADDRGLALLSSQQLHLLENEEGSSDYTEYQRAQLGNTKLALSEDQILLYRNDLSRLYDRKSLELVYEFDQVAKEAIIALESLVFASDSGMSVINKANGKEVWSSNKAIVDIALAGEELFALEANGTIHNFNGPTNLTPPVTVINTIPSEPNGNNDYYTVIPQLILESKDRESFVESSWYRLSSTIYEEYVGPTDLIEGHYTIFAYSVDNHDFRESEVFKNIMVDATEPELNLEIESALGLNGYYVDPIRVHISADDAISGINSIQYEVNDSGFETAPGSILFDEDGYYDLSVLAEDNAGNITESILSLAVDITNPIAFSESIIETGAGFIYLEATDSTSGVDRIEYSLNSSAVTAYSRPIVLGEAGEYTLQYRAIDEAGNRSEWIEENYLVPELGANGIISNLQLSFHHRSHHRDDEEREIVGSIDIGDQLYEGVHSRRNYINYLPDYLLGAEYIRFHKNDGRLFWGYMASFTVEEDADIYIVQHRRSRVHLEYYGWELIEEDIPIEPRRFFRGGGDVYHRHFEKGDLVLIPATAAWNKQPNLVFAQVSQEPRTRIVTPKRDDALYPDEGFELMAVTLGTHEPLNYHWTYQLNDFEVQIIDHEELFTVPYVEESTELFLEVHAVNSQEEIIDQDFRSYDLINETSFTILQPSDGGTLRSDKTYLFDMEAINMYGETLAIEDLTIQTRFTPHGSSSGEWLDFQLYNNQFAAPSEKGLLEMKVLLPESESRTRIYNYKWIIIDELPTFTIGFLSNEGDYTSKGQTQSTGPEGVTFGFNEDHSQRKGFFLALLDKGSDGHRFWRRFTKVVGEYIALNEDSYFEIQTGPGTFQINLSTGPVRRYRSARVGINGMELELQPRQPKALFEVTAVVEATNGIIRIDGTQGLGLMQVTVDQVSDDTELSIEAEENTEYLILYDRSPDGRHHHDHHGNDDHEQRENKDEPSKNNGNSNGRRNRNDD